LSVYIFVGPTLPADDVRHALPGANCLPPVSQGDVYRIVQKRPTIIGIIDGRFERTPAVWHKEILWAMSQGVHVFGSASMGALRAAELSAFGMEGVGAIFSDYHTGKLTDDDEVAVAEGAQGPDYVSASEAMVNIRATFAEAVGQRIISPDTERELLRIGKQLFYPDRLYTTILAKAQEASIAPIELKALSAWLPEHRINKKREDALLMLGVIGERLAYGIAPKTVDYRLQYTEAWHQAVLTAGAATSTKAPDLAEVAAHRTALPTDRLLDELRLQGVPYMSARQEALLRFLSIYYAQQQGAGADAKSIREEAHRFREALGLLDQAQNDQWMADHNLTRDGYLQLIANAVLVDWSAGAAEPNLLPHLLDHLIHSAEYIPLLKRARHKQQALAERGLDNIDLADLDLTEEALFAWYFEHHLKLERTATIPAYAGLFGYRFKEDFVRAVLHEYCYSRMLADGSTD